jgi:Cu(I)/Ag(I) efflux system membrane fusion protein
MKKFIILVMLLITSNTYAVTQNSHVGHNHNMHKEESLIKEKANFSCPMHPEITSHKKDNCSICGMFLVENKKEDPVINDSLKSNQTANFSCPMHSEVTSHKKDNCPICGMFLVENKKEDPVISDIIKMEEKAIYICPMHPEITSHEEGRCPICGMNLELKKKSNKDTQVSISGEMQQALGIRTFISKKENIKKRVNTFGEVGYNENNMNYIYSRVEGWIEKANFQSIGDKVKKGDLLYTVYSPRIIQAQQDYLLTLNSNIEDKEMMESAKLALLLLGVDSQVINQIKKENKFKINIPFYANDSGVITDIYLKKGAYINLNTKILSLTSFEDFWVTIDLFENDQNWIKENQKVLIDSKSLSKPISGKIDYIYPELDKLTRSLKARIIVANSELRPNMLVNVEVEDLIEKNEIIIPKESVIQTSKNNRVVVKLESNKFQVKDIVIGDYINEMVIVKSGLLENEEIVTSGQFLIDSESNIQESIMRIIGSN